MKKEAILFIKQSGQKSPRLAGPAGGGQSRKFDRKIYASGASFFVGDDDGDQEITPVAVAVPVLPKAHKEKEHGGDGNC
ncbi:hypothetical protein MKL73_14435 [Brucella abortus]|uniref:hypothetical protein n=1 Tax=Brucella abortus TaxID=235 RepID=UPI001558A8A7|nr:hypothetical protein [Brucella abortus]MCH1769729.1 hypothetical protein [Brucella abortus]